MKKIISYAFLFIVFIHCSGCRKKKYVEESYSYRPEYSQPYKVNDLDKGINLENWLSNSANPAEYGTRFGKRQLTDIKALGFKSVRIPIGNKVLFNVASPSDLNAENLVFVDSAVSWAIQAGLSVQLDVMHQLYDNSIEQKLKSDPAFFNAMTLYYRSIAKYFKKYPASQLYFEIFNEPNFGVTLNSFAFAEYWDKIQGRFIEAIRSETNEHYIISSGLYGSFEGLKRLNLYDDPRMLYSIHFYDPLLFTNQGASWMGWAYIINARNIPYPSNEDRMAPFVNSIPLSDQTSRYYLSQYGDDKYNALKLDTLVRNMAAWAYSKRIRIIINEFGVYKPFAPAAARVAYINDLRLALEKYHISWSMWEFDDGFGFVEYQGNNRNNPIIDRNVLNALGLK